MSVFRGAKGLPDEDRDLYRSTFTDSNTTDVSNLSGNFHIDSYASR